MSQSETAVVQPTAGARLRAILGGSAGNLVEWYDWSAYLSFTLYFAKHFFPEGDQTAQLLKAAAVSAVGFLARPVGAWLMGLYADRAGRRAALTLAVTLMCAGSLIIALAPTYAQIGALAPALLLFARILQGLSVGGEYGASATYMSEMAGRDRRGFWSSFQYVTLIGGQLTALGVLLTLQAVLDKPDLEAWGWRIAFFIGAGLAIVVFFVRRGIEESASYVNAKAAGAPRARALTLFREHPKETLMVMGLTAAGSLGFYVYTTYMQKFLVNTSGFSKDQATQINAITLIAFMLIQPLAGWVSDKVGRKPMLIAAFAGLAVFSWPILTGLENPTGPGEATLLVLAALLIQSCYSAISAVVKAELFPAHIRALGVALPYALANALFGGTAEYVALWFKSEGFERGFYIYISVISLVALIVVARLRETKEHSLILED